VRARAGRTVARSLDALLRADAEEHGGVDELQFDGGYLASDWVTPRPRREALLIQLRQLKGTCSVL
jgi:hypothetical protein